MQEQARKEVEKKSKTRQKRTSHNWPQERGVVTEDYNSLIPKKPEGIFLIRYDSYLISTFSGFLSMPLLVVFIYILLAGIGLPYALHASSLLGQIDPRCVCELANQHLILSYASNASFAFLLCFLPVAWALRWHRFQTLTRFQRARVGWFAGLLTVYVALHLNLTTYTQVFGSTWNHWSAFVAMVVPNILAILSVAMLGGHLGAKALLRLHTKIIPPRRTPLSA